MYRSTRSRRVGPQGNGRGAWRGQAGRRPALAGDRHRNNPRVPTPTHRYRPDSGRGRRARRAPFCNSSAALPPPHATHPRTRSRTIRRMGHLWRASRVPVLSPAAPSRSSTRCMSRLEAPPRHHGPGTLQGYSRDPPGILHGYYRDPPGTLQGPSRDTPGILQGHLQGGDELDKRRRRAQQLRGPSRALVVPPPLPLGRVRRAARATQGCAGRRAHLVKTCGYWL